MAVWTAQLSCVQKWPNKRIVLSVNTGLTKSHPRIYYVYDMCIWKFDNFFLWATYFKIPWIQKTYFIPSIYVHRIENLWRSWTILNGLSRVTHWHDLEISILRWIGASIVIRYIRVAYNSPLDLNGHRLHGEKSLVLDEMPKSWPVQGLRNV